MTVLPLQSGYLYGPVKSRRLGHSLGINLFPGDQKVCSFDCIYCHYGWTQVKTIFPAKDSLPPKENILQAIETALRSELEFAYLTFSGNGEPTLHPDFAEIATEVRRLRDQLRPQVNLAILSNSTTVQNPDVRASLLLLDMAIMKLDAGDDETLMKINRPLPGIHVGDIIAGLKLIPDVVVQSLLLDGEVSNIRGKAFEAWVKALAEINPKMVQIYSTDRPVPDARIEKVTPERLQQIAIQVRELTGLTLDAYWAQGK